MIRYATGSLSLIGCIFIIVTILMLKELWMFNFRLILYLALSNIIIAIGFILPYDGGYDLCVFQGFMNNFGSLSSLLWTGCIMRSLYRLIVYEEQGSKKLELLFIIICWLIPLGASLAAIKKYHRAEGWCWFASTKDNLGYILGEFYIPFIIVLSFNVFLCCKIWGYLKNNQDDEILKNLKRNAFKRFALYPIVLIICYLPVILHRFFTIVIGSNTPGMLSIFGIIGNGSYGFCCSLVYGCTKFVRGKIIEKCCKKYVIKIDSTLTSEALVLHKEKN